MITLETIGVVTNTDDPEQDQRIMAKAPLLLRSDSELPWWIPRYESAWGELDLPNVGDQVMLYYDDTDPENDQVPGETSLLSPNFRWGPFRNTTDVGTNKVPDRLLVNYPRRRGKVSRVGHYWFFDDSKDKRKQVVEIGHAAGHYVRMEQERIVIQAVAPNGAAAWAITINMKDDSVEINNPDFAPPITPVYVRLQSGKAIIEATEIDLGADADTPAVRYAELKQYLDDLTTWLGTLQVTTGAGAGGTVTGVPDPIPTVPTDMAASKPRVK